MGAGVCAMGALPENRHMARIYRHPANRFPARLGLTTGDEPMTRSFEDRPATREKTPLLLGLVGPSASGKTYSALRLATGIQRVCGGEIFMIDTEARRGLHYADKFKFRHIAFGAAFSPLDYLEAIEHCTKKGAGVIVVDS